VDDVTVMIVTRVFVTILATKLMDKKEAKGIF
jgi:hypothetical protein